MSGKIIVHNLNESRSNSTLWMMEELGVNYDVEQYYRQKDMRAPAQLRDVHPLGKAPVITLEDGTNLAESGAIVTYIIGKYGRDKVVVPEDGYISDIYYANYAEGSLMPILVNRLVFTLIPNFSPWFIRPLMRLIFGQLDKLMIVPELERHIPMIEKHLENMKAKSTNPDGSFFFAGGSGPTSADFLMQMPLEGIAKRVTPIGLIIPEYVKQNQARPAYEKAVVAGGGFHG